MRRLPDLVIVAVLVALVAVPLVAGPGGRGGADAFAGADAVATERIAEDGYRPWAEPVLTPSSPEVESGLFAVQAAIGAGVLGYVLGALRERSRRRGAPAAADG